jgi:hypothetical protein
MASHRNRALGMLVLTLSLVQASSALAESKQPKAGTLVLTNDNLGADLLEHKFEVVDHAAATPLARDAPTPICYFWPRKPLVLTLDGAPINGKVDLVLAFSRLDPDGKRTWVMDLDVEVPIFMDPKPDHPWMLTNLAAGRMTALSAGRYEVSLLPAPGKPAYASATVTLK